MSWTEATFTNRSGKRQQVWIQTDEAGEPVLDDGRIQMRYQDSEDAKVYGAHPRNIAVGDGASKNGEPKNGKSKSTKSANKVAVDDSVWKDPVGERVVRRELPRQLEGEPPPRDGVIDIWTDGACTGNPGPCGLGVIVRYGEQYMEIGQYVGIGTNNIGELLAIGVALDEVRDIAGKLEIHTDSTYSIGVLSKNWKAKANKELIAWIKELVAERDVKFVKVKGHAGIPLNERADRLAVAAVERRK